MRMKIRSLFLMGLLSFGLADAEEQKLEVVPDVDVMTMVQDARCKQVVVTCLINDQPMRMMLDSGATHTVLHKESAERLEGVQRIDTSAMQFRGNSQQRPEMLMAPLLAGPARFPQHLFMVLDLSAVRGAMAEPIDGILGMDVLGSVPFTFDQRKNAFFWGVAAGAELVPLRGKQDRFGRWMVQAVCQGKPLVLLLDTGSSVTRVHEADWTPGPGEVIEAHVGNVDKSARISIREGAAADLDVAEGIMLRGVKPIFGQPGEPPVLGMDALRGAVLVHLLTEASPYGAFYLAK